MSKIWASLVKTAFPVMSTFTWKEYLRCYSGKSLRTSGQVFTFPYIFFRTFWKTDVRLPKLIGWFRGIARYRKINPISAGSLVPLDILLGGKYLDRCSKMCSLTSAKKLIFGNSCLEHHRTVIACKSYDVRNIDVISWKLISKIKFFGKNRENNKCRSQYKMWQDFP